MRICDGIGRLLQAVPLGRQATSAELEGLPPGLYVLHLRYPHRAFIRKLVIVR